MRNLKAHDSSEDDLSDLDEYVNKLTAVKTKEIWDDDSDIEDVVKQTSEKSRMYPTIKLNHQNGS